MFGNDTWRLLRHLDAGDGGGSGTGTGPGTNPGTPSTPPANPGTGGETPPPADPAVPQVPPATPPAKKDSYTPVEFQAALNAEAGRIRQEIRSDLEKQAERKAQEAASAAEADKKAKAGEFKPLYEEEKTKREALETRAASLAERVNNTLDAVIKDWPDSLKKTDPGKDNVEARMGWVDTHSDLANQLLSVNTPPEARHGRQGLPAAGGNGGTGATGNARDITSNVLNQQYRVPGRQPTT